MKKIKLTKKIEKDIREDSVRVRKAWFKKLREFADKFEKNPTDLNKMYLLGFISSADFIIITFKAMQHPKTDRELREEFHIYSIKMAHQSADGELDMKEIEGKIADFWLAKMREREEAIIREIELAKEGNAENSMLSLDERFAVNYALEKILSALRAKE